MKKLLLASMLLGLPHSVFCAPPPSIYKKFKRASPEVMVVCVGKVTQYRYAYGKMYIKARAKVLSVSRSSRRLRRGSWITNRYKMLGKRSRGTFGAAPTPALVGNHVYRVYLSRDRHSHYFSPAAGNQSFVKLY
jgi:hypothetical protein